MNPPPTPTPTPNTEDHGFTDDERAAWHDLNAFVHGELHEPSVKGARDAMAILAEWLHRFPVCAICGADPDHKATVYTGGGCDYAACGDAHNAAIGLALDAADAAADAQLPAPPWPVAYPPDWVGDAPATGTVADLEAWVAAHPDAMAAPAQ